MSRSPRDVHLHSAEAGELAAFLAPYTRIKCPLITISRPAPWLFASPSECEDPSATAARIDSVLLIPGEKKSCRLPSLHGQLATASGTRVKSGF